MGILVDHFLEQINFCEERIKNINSINTMILSPYERGLIDGKRIVYEAQLDYFKDAVKILSL